jgi:DNA-binding response OmpR family regulator
MSSGAAAERAAATGPRILIVDDDRRILELLEIAFTAHGFRVLTAPDGEEATKLTLAERPDLVVLDVRLPKKSGLEVCEWLRKDPDDPLVPILMLSAVTDTETRLQAFTRGADDYLTKPFSPKELIARVKRLLARSAGAREAHVRQVELEREASHATDEAGRTRTAAQREQRLQNLVVGLGLDLLGTLDEDELARRLLPLARARLGAGMAGLLLPERDDGPLAPAAIRGDGLERLAGLELPRSGALAALLAGLERPVACRDLERFPDLAEDLAPLAAVGVSLLVPLRGPQGLEGLLVLDERGDGLPYPPFELELLARLSPLAGVALHNARRARAHVERVLEELAARGAPVAEVAPDAEAVLGAHAALGAEARRSRAEAVLLAEHAARATLLPPRQRRLLAHAIRLGRCAPAGAEVEALARLAADEPTGLVRDLAALIARVTAPASHEEPAPEEARAGVLLAVALAHADERERGADFRAALTRAIAAAGGRLDPITRQALEGAARELELSAIETE